MKYQAGFIGVGNMGGALAAAAWQSEKNIALCDHHADKVARFLAEHPGAAAADQQEIAREAAFVFLGVKPHAILALGGALAGELKKETCVVTMAAGITLHEMCVALNSDRVIRIMPNTPAAAGQGLTLYCMAPGVTEQDEQAFLRLMGSSGVLDRIDEGHMDAAAALSGCGPAYVYMFAEALADGAVRCGLPRDKALLYAKQTILGSAAMMLQSPVHPEGLKDAVCSPGGTTIEGVLALEQNGFRYAAASAVMAAYDKTARLKK